LAWDAQGIAVALGELKETCAELRRIDDRVYTKSQRFSGRSRAHKAEWLTLYVETTEKGGGEELRFEPRNETGGQGRCGEKTTFFVDRFTINGSGASNINIDNIDRIRKQNILDLLEAPTSPK